MRVSVVYIFIRRLEDPMTSFILTIILSEKLELLIYEYKFLGFLMLFTM